VNDRLVPVNEAAVSVGVPTLVKPGGGLISPDATLNAMMAFVEGPKVNASGCATP